MYAWNYASVEHVKASIILSYCHITIDEICMYVYIIIILYDL